MKQHSIKQIEIFSNGTVNFSLKCLVNLKQVVFYEKDFINSQIFSKAKKFQNLQISSRAFYKSKYRV